MMNMKKMLALLLAVVMVLGMIPFGAMAEEAEPVTHIETCLEGCALEDCACTCHAAPETPAEEPKQEQPPVAPASLDDTQTQETPVCTCTPVEGVHAEACALYVKPEAPVCTCTPAEDGTHAEGCALYVKPEAPVEEPKTEETPVCTCTPVEGVHAEGCALYVKPEAPVEEPKTEETPVCTCTPVEGVHAEACALYGDKVEDSVHTGECNDACEVEDCECECHAAKEPSFDADAAYKHLMSLENKTAIEEYLSSLTDEQCLQISNLITEEDGLVLGSRMGYVIEAETYKPLKSYTNVGPLMPPVKVPARTFRLLKKSGSSENGLILSKVSTPVDGGYKITLEAYTTGTVTNSSVSVPTDIVLVLDESGSMADSMYQYKKTYSINTSNTYYIKNGDTYTAVRYCDSGSCEGWKTGLHIDLIIFNFHWGNSVNDPMTSETDTAQGHIQFYERDETSTSKRDALENAATQFVNSVYNDATNNNVDHRIAVIGFAGDGASRIKIGLVDDIRNNRGNVNTNGTILYAVNNLNANGGTYIEDGMSNAKTAFDKAAITSSTTRNRVVVVFTDGVPGSGSWSDSTIRDSANPAISTAKNLKSIYGATVYTIGMLDDADPTLPISDENNDTARTNKFLHYLSTNYPNAVSMSDGGSGGGNKGYYLAASDADSLDTIFQKIANQISTPTIQLDGDTVIKDIVAPQFNIPSGAVINTYTAAYDGSNFGSRVEEKISTSISGDTVTVTGFNFNDNFISTTGRGTDNNFYGKKLIIEFIVTVDSDFLGGNGVLTNGSASGVYSDGKLVENFPMPDTDIELKVLQIGLATVDQNIYLSNDADLAALVTSLDQRINGTNNAYVDIKYEIKDGETVIGTVTIPAGGTLPTTITWTEAEGQDMTPNLDAVDTKNYTIVATASPTSTGTYTATENIKTEPVNVFKPVVYFQDSEINAGATPVYATENYVKVEWKNGNTLASNVTMRGTEPQLVYTYNPVAAPLNAKSEVQITAVATTDQKTIALNNVTFIRNACNLANGCGHPGGTVDMTKDGYINFIVHMKTCDLVITKSVNKLENAADTFIFTVAGPNGFSKTVVINGAGSVTIADLPIGSYTVTEDTAWSWRYECSAPSITKTIAPNDNTFAFTNTFNPDSKWLTDTSYAQNLFGSTSAVIK